VEGKQVGTTEGQMSWLEIGFRSQKHPKAEKTLMNGSRFGQVTDACHDDMRTHRSTRSPLIHPFSGPQQYQ